MALTTHGKMVEGESGGWTYKDHVNACATLLNNSCLTAQQKDELRMKYRLPDKKESPQAVPNRVDLVE